VAMAHRFKGNARQAEADVPAVAVLVLCREWRGRCGKLCVQDGCLKHLQVRGGLAGTSSRRTKTAVRWGCGEPASWLKPDIALAAWNRGRCQGLRRLPGAIRRRRSPCLVVAGATSPQ